MLPQGSRIWLGVYSVTGMYGPVERWEAVGLLRAAAALGVGGFDTADIYGYGLGEELVCEALGGGRGVFVATKIGYDLSSRPPRPRYERGYLLSAAEASAGRLCRRPVDLVQLHNPPLEVLRGDWVWELLGELRDRGLARYVGVALGPETDVLPHALAVLDHSDVVDYIQFVYNVLEQEPGLSIARLAAGRGVRVLARVPHAGGVLDETLREPRLPGDHRGLRRRGWLEWALRVYRERVKPVLDPLPGTPGQKAVRFILDTLDPEAVIVVAKTPGAVAEYLGAERLPPLPRGVLEELRRVYLEEAWGSPEAPVESLRLARELGLLD